MKERAHFLNGLNSNEDRKGKGSPGFFWRKPFCCQGEFMAKSPESKSVGNGSNVLVRIGLCSMNRVKATDLETICCFVPTLSSGSCEWEENKPIEKLCSSESILGIAKMWLGDARCEMFS